MAIGKNTIDQNVHISLAMELLSNKIGYSRISNAITAVVALYKMLVSQFDI